MQKQWHIIKAKLHDLNKEDKVCLKSNHKFNNKFIDPFTIIKEIYSVNFEIQRTNNSKAPITKVQIDCLWIAPRRRLHLEFSTSIDHHLAEPSEPIIVPQTNENTDNTDRPPNQQTINFLILLTLF